jgi:Holliday junction resolvase RusA-like endonuclease
VKLEVLFVLPRPKGHHGTGRNAGVPKASAPQWPTVKPDTTKLLRAVEDACTSILWRDDAQIVIQTACKVYGDPARCEITVRPLAAQLSIHDKEAAA